MTSLLIRDIAKTQLEDGDKVYTDGLEKLKEYFSEKVWDAVDVSGAAVRKFALSLPAKIEADGSKTSSSLSSEQIYQDNDFTLMYYYNTGKMQLMILNIDKEIRTTYSSCLSLSDQTKLYKDLGEFEFTSYSRGKVLLSTKFVNPSLSVASTTTGKFILAERLED